MSTVTDEIKARADLVELIGRSVPLRKSGSNYKGLCPFHQEKTPSFYVFPASHTWVCFGCGKKGSAFDWLMEREHLEFGEALRQLAQQTGVELPDRREPEQEEATSRLYALLARAQAYYQALLEGTAGQAARSYLARRGVDEATSTAFGLGYAAAGNGLMRHLAEAGYSNDELVAAGVVGESDDGRLFDFFRERLIIPIRDPQGRPIAFGGRGLDERATPKYLNSRDTLLFHKQETLFALDLARRPMSQERRAVIVEGYFDAVMAHQHGYRNVVATLGTALTDRHLRLLRRAVDEIVLALDSDAAGQAATWRALQLADESLRSGLRPVVGPSRAQRRMVPDHAVRLRILTLPGAKDPDELIRADATQWPILVQGAQPVIDFVLARLGVRHDLSSADGKAAAAEEIAELLGGIADPIEQAHYVQQVAQLLKVDEQAVRRTLRGQRRQPSRAAAGAVDGARPSPGASRPEVEDSLDEYVLALVARVRAELGGSLDPAALPAEAELRLPESRALLRALVADGDAAERLRERVPELLRPYAERVERRLADARRLEPERLLAELGDRRLEMQRRGLLERKRALVQLIRENHEDQGELTTALGQIAQAINALDMQLVPVAAR